MLYNKIKKKNKKKLNIIKLTKLNLNIKKTSIFLDILSHGKKQRAWYFKLYEHISVKVI